MKFYFLRAFFYFLQKSCKGFFEIYYIIQAPKKIIVTIKQFFKIWSKNERS